MLFPKKLLGRLAPLVLLSSLIVADASAQKLYAWGDNGVGQCNIQGAAPGRVVAIRTGYYMSYAQKADGTIVATGDNSYGELNIPVAAQSGVTKLGAGVLHGLAIKDGGVIAWGSNERGEINVPTNLKSVADGGLGGVTDISGGEYYSLALQSGKVIGWGNNDYGVMNIPGSVQSGVSAIASGSYHSLALKNGGVIGWGMDVAGSLQIPVAAQSGVTKIACGYLHSLALKTDGSVVAWGWNSMGQVNVPVAAQSGVVAVSAGYDFSVALKADGTIVMWGDNDYGWLNKPGGVEPAVAISGSAYHTMALKAEAWATLDQTEVFSGDAATGTVHLNTPATAGGVNVDVVSDTPGVHVPATVFVAEGESTATFPVTTDNYFGAEFTATMRASFEGTASVATFLKIKSTPLNVSLNRSNVVGGSTTKLTTTLSLTNPATANITFNVGSSDSGVLSAPATATILNGQTSVTVPLTHNYVDGVPSKNVTLSFTNNSVTAATKVVNVQAFSATVSLASPNITSGESTYAFVTLNAVPRTSLPVTIVNSHPRVTVPSSVTVNAGATTTFFQIQTDPAEATFVYPVTVSINHNSFSTSLTVGAAPAVKSITLPNSIVGNTKVTGTVTLTRPAGPGGQVVSLVTAGSISVPTTVTVAEGATTATFDVVAADVPTAEAARVTAGSDVNEIVKNLTVPPMTPITLELSAGSVLPNSSFTGTVTLRAIVHTDTVVQLTVSNLTVSVPATVTVLAGTNSVTFTAHAGATTVPKQSRINATKNGKSIKATILVSPP